MDWISTGSVWTTRKTKKRQNPERKEQISLVKWLRLVKAAFTSIPNEGRRSRILGALMKAMGLTAGVSDLFICEMRGGFGGFWVEMKAKGKRPTPDQVSWINLMRDKGYRAEWYDTWHEAQKAIDEYMKS